MERFSRNYSAISNLQQNILRDTKVLVIGLGGLGGIVCEGLARLGVYEFGICDFDVIEVSNLNRQLIAKDINIGSNKVSEMVRHIEEINREAIITPYFDRFDDNNAEIISVLSSYDLIFDCLDNMESRKCLQKHAIEANVPIIYGAMHNYYGYVGVTTRDNMILDIFNDIEHEIAGSPFYTPGIIASLQILLGTKVLFDEPYLKKGFYYIDLQKVTIEEIEF